MKKSIFLTILVLFIAQFANADCWDKARDFRDKLHNGRDSLDKKCLDIENSAQKIIGKCSGGYKCNSTHFMEDTLYYAKECQSETPYTDPDINIFDDCESAFGSLNRYGKKLSEAQKNLNKAITAYNDFWGLNK